MCDRPIGLGFDRSVSTVALVTTAETLRAIALQEFTSSGYLGTSLARIAERAGVSKANVLYHYSSKEALLEAVIRPAIDELGAIVEGLASRRLSPTGREDFLVEYVDFLFRHRLAVHLFISQRTSLVDVPACQRAQEQIQQLVGFLKTAAPDVEGRMRVGVALAGSAHLLAAGPEFGQADDLDDVREPLLAVLRLLLLPAAASTAATPSPDSLPA